MEPSFSHSCVAPGLYAILCPGYMPGPGRLPGFGRTIVYLVTGDEQALLFDTGYGNADLMQYVRGITELPVMAVNSHVHPDHAGGNAQFDVVHVGRNEVCESAPVYIPDDNALHSPCEAVRRAGDYRYAFLDDGQIIDLGARQLQVVEIPGHTPGSIALLDRTSRLLLSGDAVLKRVLLVGKVPIATYRQALLRTDALDFDDIYGSHWPEPLGRDYIRKMVALLDDFDPARAESSPWQESDADFAMVAHGNAFEEPDFCAIGYRTDELEILLG